MDTHQHFWWIGRHDYPWLDPALAIHRDYGPEHLRPVLGGIVATVLVQASPTVAETRTLIDVARVSEGLVRGVVGWVDLGAPAADGAIADLAAHGIVKGVRPMLGFIEDTRWILGDTVRAALDALARHGLRLDVPARPRHLPLLPELAQRHPTLAIVIDHGAKPAIARDEFASWARNIARVARETPMYCKLSGLATEAKADWTDDDLRPYVDHLLECFGAERLMWGSDWPVVVLAGGMSRWREAALRLVPASSHRAIMRDTAITFYGL
ncbi:MAG: amidohydrolase family protein [Burkholderiales bacterium]|nr:amidohydrolase family protein [Burkholderiales bacterium]